MTPYPTRAISVVGPGAKRAFAAASLKTSTGTTTTSNGVPEVTRAMMFGVESKWVESLWPVAFSNSGVSAFRQTIIEPPAITLSSTASAPGDRPSTPAVMVATSGFFIIRLRRSIRDQYLGDKPGIANGLSGKRRTLLEPGTWRRCAPERLSPRVLQRPPHRLVVMVHRKIVAGVELHPMAVGIA